MGNIKFDDDSIFIGDENNSVVSFNLSDDGRTVEVMENCDYYFSVNLSYQEMLELSIIIDTLANNMNRGSYDY